jgi:hypothetical protein
LKKFAFSFSESLLVSIYQGKNIELMTPAAAPTAGPAAPTPAAPID